MEEKANSKTRKLLSLAHLFLLITLAVSVSNLSSLFLGFGVQTIFSLAAMAVPILLFFSEKKGIRIAISVIAISVSLYTFYLVAMVLIQMNQYGAVPDIEFWMRYTPRFASALLMLFCGIRLLTNNSVIRIIHIILSIATFFAVFIFTVSSFSVGMTALSAVISDICTILGYGLLPGTEFAEPRKVKVKLSTAIVTAVLVLVLCFTGVLGGYSSGGGGSGSHTAVCSSCGRSFSAGDDGGNYMNIARTGMCKNCYNNFKWGRSAIGQD